MPKIQNVGTVGTVSTSAPTTESERNLVRSIMLVMVHMRYKRPNTGTYVLTAMLIISLPGCFHDKHETPTPQLAESCSPTMPSEGQEAQIPHPNTPSQCLGVVLKCNYCEYDRRGNFVKTEFEICGACVGADF